MSDKIRDIDIKIRTYFFFDNIISVKNFYPNNIRIDEKSYKYIFSYYTRYVTKKRFEICKN